MKKFESGKPALISSMHSSDLPPPLFKGGRVNFDFLPWGRESEKWGGSMVQGQVFLKGGS